MPVTNAFAGADYVPGENQSTVEGAVTQGWSTGSTAFGAGQAAVPSGGSISGMFKSAASSVTSLLNPTNARNAISGLFPGGKSAAATQAPTVGFAEGAGTSSAAESDWRVRVSLADNSQLFYKIGGSSSTQNQLMAPLVETNGVIFPYTPQITVSHVANYSSASLTHSNYAMQFYNNSEVADIVITGDFTVQNISEGQYLMAAVYFLRSATKMFFGQGANAGNPPPMLFLDGYGSHYFPHVPCVLTNFSHTLPNDVDYIQIPLTSTTLTEVQVASQDTSNYGAVDMATNSITGPNGETYAPNFNLVGVAGNEAAAAKLAANNAKAATTKMEYKTMTSYTRVPTQSSISITLRPVYSRKNLHERFDLDKFAMGGLLYDKDKGYGGFL